MKENEERISPISEIANNWTYPRLPNLESEDRPSVLVLPSGRRDWHLGVLPRIAATVRKLTVFRLSLAAFRVWDDVIDSAVVEYVNLVLAELAHGGLVEQLLPTFETKESRFHLRPVEDRLHERAEFAPADLSL